MLQLCLEWNWKSNKIIKLKLKSKNCLHTENFFDFSIFIYEIINSDEGFKSNNLN